MWYLFYCKSQWATETEHNKPLLMYYTVTCKYNVMWMNQLIHVYTFLKSFTFDVNAWHNVTPYINADKLLGNITSFVQQHKYMYDFIYNNKITAVWNINDDSSSTTCTFSNIKKASCHVLRCMLIHKYVFKQH